jgi:hypothetical protein
MKYKFLIAFIFLIFSCEDEMNIRDKSKYDVFQTKNNEKIKIYNDKIVFCPSEINGTFIGRQMELDSNFILRKDLWYCGYDEPFFQVNYLSENIHSELIFKMYLFDTTLIKFPQLNCIKNGLDLNVDIISKYYPVRMLGIETYFSTNPTNYTTNYMNNTISFVLPSHYEDSIIRVKFHYTDIEDQVIFMNDTLFSLTPQISVK